MSIRTALLACTFATLCAAGLFAATASAEAPFALTSTSVELPVGDRAFPDGPNVEVIRDNCQTCHSPGMILNQPALSRGAWTGEVQKMIHVYKAPVDEADAPRIVDYLVATKGAN